MNLIQLKSQLQVAIPEELYKIAPGQIAYLTPYDGLSEQTTYNLSNVFYIFSHFGFGEQIKLQILPTDKPELIGAVVGRKDSETGTPYNLIISDEQSLIGFLADYFSLNVDEFVARSTTTVLAKNIMRRRGVRPEEQPLIISINPYDYPVPSKSNESGAHNFSCPFLGNSMRDDDSELLVVKPEKGSKEEKKLIAREAKKLEKVLRECAVFEIELDIDKIKRKVKDSLKSEVEYQLILDIDTIKEGPLSFCNTCDIYVADGEEYMLKLTAVEKAVYLTFLLFEKGIRILDTFEGFRQITQKIYNQLPDEDKCEKTAGGILDKGAVNPVVYADTLRTYISHVRDEVADKITHPLVAQGFAIEGLKDSEFGIARSTPAIRAQIRDAFNL